MMNRPWLTHLVIVTAVWSTACTAGTRVAGQETLSASMRAMTDQLLAQLETYGEFWTLVVTEVTPIDPGNRAYEQLADLFESALASQHVVTEPWGDDPFWAVMTRRHVNALLSKHHLEITAFTSPKQRLQASQITGANAWITLQLTRLPTRFQLTAQVTACDNGQILATASGSFSHRSELAYLMLHRIDP